MRHPDAGMRHVTPSCVTRFFDLAISMAGELPPCNWTAKSAPDLGLRMPRRPEITDEDTGSVRFGRSLVLSTLVAYHKLNIVIWVIRLRSHATFADQLLPFAARMRTTHPTVRHVVQVTAFLGGKEPEIAADEARKQTLRWLQKRAGPLPEHAWDGQSFEREIPGQHVSTVSLTEPPYWVARLDHPDSEVAGRSWSTEITVGVGSERSQFGLRLRCSSRDYDPDPALTIPGIVRQIAERPGLEDYGVPLTLQPWILKNVADVERLTRLLENPNRQRPVYVISLPNDQVCTDPALIDTAELAIRCIGVAYVVVLSSPLSFTLRDILGKEHSVFGGAVRSYMPNFAVGDQLPFKHPLALSDRIADWPSGGPTAFADMLIRKAFEWSVRNSDREQNLPTYSFVKRLALARRERDLASETNTDERPLNLNDQLSDSEGRTRTGYQK